MNIGYVFLIIMASAAYIVSGIPTPEEMIADFKAAQKFYTSGAYDQAVDGYTAVGNVESPFVDEDKVIVEFGDMQMRIKDATLYQSGNSYYKMTEDELRKSSEAFSDEEKEKADRLALEYVNRSTEFFKLTQEQTINDELKVLAQKRIVDAWYLIYDYDKVIEEGQNLIENYPESSYIQDSLYNIGWAYYDTKRYDQSIDTFQELITRYPTGSKSDRALFQIGESYFDQGDYDQAAPNYQRLVDKMRINELTDLEILKIQRDKLAGLTDETALDLAAKAALKIGACHGNSGNYEQASISYKRIAQLFRYDKALISEAYQRLADMYYDRGDFDETIQAYRDAIDEIDDTMIAAKMQVLIAQRYFDNEYYDNSVTEYNTYINVYSEVAFRAGFDLDLAFFSLARAHYELGVSMIRNDQRELGLDNIQQSIQTYQRIFEDFPATGLTERVNFYLAVSYQEYGTEEYIRNAINTYNLLMEQYPETPYREYSYQKLARAYKTLEEYDTALSYFNRVIEEFPDIAQKDGIWFEMGLTTTDNGDEIGAVEYFQNISREDPRLFTTARLISAQTLLQNGRDSEVIDVLTYALEDQSAIESPYRLSQLYLIRGNAYKNIEDFESAVSDYSSAYNLNIPETMEVASVQRAGVYIEQEQFAQAENDLKELMDSDNEDIQLSAQIRLAIISARLGKSEQAIQTYLDLYNSATDPVEKLDYLRNIIQLSSVSEDWDSLKNYAEIMLDSDDADGKQPEGQNFFYKEEAYYFMGNTLETQGNTNEGPGGEITPAAQDYYLQAVDYLLRGFDEFPDSYFSSDMLLKVGVLYLTKLGGVPDAIDLAAQYFEDYISKFPDTQNAEMAHYYLGFCYYNGRRFSEAVETFRNFASTYPNSEFTPEAIFYYSDGYYNIGELELGIEGFDDLISRYPSHEKISEAYYTKAWAFLDLEREDDAIEAFRALVDRFPRSEFASTSLFSVADYYYNLQQYESAMENYQRVLDEYPETEVAQRVPETLKDLTETVAYIEYERGWNIFSEAQDTRDNALYEEAVAIFRNIVDNYPDTESEIGAYSNMGICYEALSRWLEAIEAYDNVIRKYEEGAAVSEEAFTFANMHKNYIEANRL